MWYDICSATVHICCQICTFDLTFTESILGYFLSPYLSDLDLSLICVIF